MKSIAQSAAGGLIAGSLVLAAYLLATANMNGADGGDWLAFAGVVVGVVATISASIAIDRLKERRAHRTVKSSLLSAINIWIETVNSTPENLNKGRFADLRQQHAYITSIATELTREAMSAKMACHNFSYHVPAMINGLERAVNEEEGVVQDAFVSSIVGEMRSYGMTVRKAVAVS